jgi:tRNA modification GTPase
MELADILLWLGEAEDAPDHPQVIRVHARCDLPDRGSAPSGSMPVSSITGEGLSHLTAEIVGEARLLLPAEGELALNRRQSECIGDARDALRAAAGTSDLVLIAESLRGARSAVDRLIGRAGVEDLLDALFGRFCLGK